MLLCRAYVYILLHQLSYNHSSLSLLTGVFVMDSRTRDKFEKSGKVGARLWEGFHYSCHNNLWGLTSISIHFKWLGPETIQWTKLKWCAFAPTCPTLLSFPGNHLGTSFTLIMYICMLFLKCADISGIQFRILNRSKGPAVWVSYVFVVLQQRVCHRVGRLYM